MGKDDVMDSVTSVSYLCQGTLRFLKAKALNMFKFNFLTVVNSLNKSPNSTGNCRLPGVFVCYMKHKVTKLFQPTARLAAKLTSKKVFQLFGNISAISTFMVWKPKECALSSL